MQRSQVAQISRQEQANSLQQQQMIQQQLMLANVMALQNLQINNPLLLLQKQRQLKRQQELKREQQLKHEKSLLSQQLEMDSNFTTRTPAGHEGEDMNLTLNLTPGGGLAPSFSPKEHRIPSPIFSSSSDWKKQEMNQSAVKEFWNRSSPFSDQSNLSGDDSGFDAASLDGSESRTQQQPISNKH